MDERHGDSGPVFRTLLVFEQGFSAVRKVVLTQLSCENVSTVVCFPAVAIHDLRDPKAHAEGGHRRIHSNSSLSNCRPRAPDDFGCHFKAALFAGADGEFVWTGFHHIESDPDMAMCMENAGIPKTKDSLPAHLHHPSCFLFQTLHTTRQTFASRDF